MIGDDEIQGIRLHRFFEIALVDIPMMSTFTSLLESISGKRFTACSLSRASK